MSATYTHMAYVVVSVGKLQEAMSFRRHATLSHEGRLQLRHDEVLKREKGTCHHILYVFILFILNIYTHVDTNSCDLDAISSTWAMLDEALLSVRRLTMRMFVSWCAVLPLW